MRVKRGTWVRYEIRVRDRVSWHSASWEIAKRYIALAKDPVQVAFELGRDGEVTFRIKGPSFAEISIKGSGDVQE